MSQRHPYHHAHVHTSTEQRLRFAVVLTVVVLVVEVVAGFLAHSLALLSDAGHVFTDVFALLLASFAAGQSERPADARNTYGYHRTGILTALANAVTLILVVLGIAYEAVRRLQHPEAVVPGLMLVAPAIGIAVNMVIAFRLRSDGADLNMRAALLHVVGDIGASAAVILAAIVILLTGWNIVDPLLSLGIAVVIARGAWRVLREALSILMEATPPGVNVPALVADIRRIPEVKGVHDLHVWSIAAGMRAMSAHVQVHEDCLLSDCDALEGQVRTLLQTRYGIGHSTLQFECAGCSPNVLYCSLQAHNHNHTDDAGREAATETTEAKAD